MASSTKDLVLVIVGPTASGKSDIAMNVAKRRNGEIICADSRTIYKGMDLGTAKPTKEDQKEIPHHLLDIVRPGEKFTAYDFKKRAEEAIQDIQSRGKLPILVGGTGLYIDSVILDYQFSSEIDPTKRVEFEKLAVEQLIEYCYKSNINLPKNYKNKRHLVSAILHNNNTLPEKRDKPKSTIIVVGITTEKDVLKQRIAKRAEYIFSHGVVEEAKKLGKMYGWENEAMTGNIYPLIKSFLENKISLEEAKAKFVTLDWRLAKRQLTWLRRHDFICWYPLDKIEEIIITTLAKAEQK